MAGLQTGGALIEIMNEDGTMARMPDLLEIAKKFDLKIISIADIIAYRLRNESIVGTGGNGRYAHAVGPLQADSVPPEKQRTGNTCRDDKGRMGKKGSLYWYASIRPALPATFSDHTAAIAATSCTNRCA